VKERGEGVAIVMTLRYGAENVVITVGYCYCTDRRRNN